MRTGITIWLRALCPPSFLKGLPLSGQSSVSFVGLSAVKQTFPEHLLWASPFVRCSTFEDESRMTFRQLQDQEGRCHLHRWLFSTREKVEKSASHLSWGVARTFLKGDSWRWSLPLVMVNSLRGHVATFSRSLASTQCLLEPSCNFLQIYCSFEIKSLKH